MFLGTHTCTYKINSDVKGLLSFSGIHKEEDIDQAIQGLSPESDIDFYPICIFDENDVQRDPWTAFFYFRLLFNWLYSIKLYIEKVQLTSIMRRHLLLWSEVFKNEWIHIKPFCQEKQRAAEFLKNLDDIFLCLELTNIYLVGIKKTAAIVFSLLFLKNLFQKGYRKSKWLCLFAPHFSSQDTWKNTLNKSQNHRWKPPKNCTIHKF